MNAEEGRVLIGEIMAYIVPDQHYLTFACNNG